MFTFIYLQIEVGFMKVFLLYVKKNNTWYQIQACIPKLLYFTYFAFKLFNNMWFLDHAHIVVYILH